MPLNGTLQTLSLPNLIQLQCNQPQASRVHLVRGGREGTLCFENGELVFASAGPLRGEDAVSEMLAWEDGDFTVSDVVEAPERNVNAPWSMLVLEALHRIDETRAGEAARPERSLAQAKSRGDFSSAVIANEAGAIVAAATDESAEPEAALAAFIAGHGQAIGDIMSLGAFERIVATRAGERICVERIGERCLACRLDERASLEPIRELANKIRDNAEQ